MAELAHFPPLPPIPIRPAGPADERQRRFHHIVGSIIDALCDEGDVEAADVSFGFRASAVDLGALQDMIHAGLAPFNMQQIRERWDVDVQDWLAAMIRGWVQRYKLLRFELCENGVHITLQTQDDRGYYAYEFDAFPGRR